MKNEKPVENAMPSDTYRVARMEGDRIEVLAEFTNEADAIDMADRAKYRQPFVLRARADGTVEVLGILPTVKRLSAR